MPHNKDHPETVTQAILPRKKGVKKRPRPAGPDTGAGLASKAYSKADKYGDIAAGAASVAKAMPSYGRTSKALKAAVAGFAGGVEMGAASMRYKEAKAAKAAKKKKKGGKTQGTVSDAATKQMSRAHKKDPTNTERV